MPVAAGVGIATAIAGIYGAHKSSESTDKASTIKAKSDADALALARQQEATRKQEYDDNLKLQQQQWDAQQNIRAPYRAAGANALHKLGDILGVDFGSGYTGPTPSTPSTFGQPTGTAGPSPAFPNQTAFNTGAQTIQDQITHLPADAAGTSGPQGTPSVTPPSTNPTDPAGILAALTKQYGDLGVKPTGPGSGPTDIEYYAGKVTETGGLTPDNINFWFGPNGRIASDLAKATGGGTKKTTTQTPGITSLAPPLSAPLVGGVGTPGYSPIIPITGLMGRGPSQ